MPGKGRSWLGLDVVLLVLGVLGYVLASSPAHGDELRMSIYPRVAVSPAGKGATVRVTLRVPASSDNESFQLDWQYAYPGEGGHSYRALDERSPVQFVRYFDRIPPGITTFVAEVRTKDGKTQRVEETIEVK